MSRDCLLGVDVGTSAVKATLFDVEGNTIRSASQELDIQQSASQRIEQDPDVIYGTVLSAVRAVVEDCKRAGERVLCLAIAAQMAGVLGVDTHGHAVTPYDSWLDTRCAPYIALMDRVAGKFITELGGAAPTVGPGAKMLWWMHEEPDAFSRIDKFLTLSAYLASRLCDLHAADAFIDFTHLHFMGFADNSNLTWSDDLVRAFGFPMTKLPHIVSPTAIVGVVSESASKACGLAAGTPVAAGCGDTAASLLGAAAVDPGTIVDVGGTASAFIACVDAFLPDVRHRVFMSHRSVFPGVWYLSAYVNGGGHCLKWLVESVAPDIAEEAASQGVDPYQWLDAAAAHVPAGSEGLLFFPYMAGRACPAQPNARGVYFGLSWLHKRPHFYRAILEGIAHEYRLFLETLKELLPDTSFQVAKAIGGASRSALWNQIKADILGIPYVTLDRHDLGVVGAALVAGRASGVITDLKNAALSWTGTVARYVPNHGTREVYSRMSREYIRLSRLIETAFAATEHG